MACLPRWEFLGISCSTSGPSHVTFWMLFPKHLRDQTNSKKQLSCISQKTQWFPVGFLHNFWQTSLRVRSFVAISGFFLSRRLLYSLQNRHFSGEPQRQRSEGPSGPWAFSEVVVGFLFHIYKPPKKYLAVVIKRRSCCPKK